MRSLFLVGLVLLGLSGCDLSSSTHPDVRQTLTRGGTSWAIVNYWAEWCAPCRDEIPELNRLARDLGTKIAVYGVNFDRLQGDVLRAQAAEMGIEFDLMELDPGPELGVSLPPVLPTTVVITPDGVVSKVLVGPQTYESLLEEVEGT